MLRRRMRQFVVPVVKATRRKSGKYLRRQELRMKARVAKRLTGQKDWVIRKMASFSYFPTDDSKALEQKNYLDDINGLVDELPYAEGMVDDIIAIADPSYRRGVNTGIEELSMGRFGVTFDLVNQEAVQYLENLRTLELSDFRGNITNRTKQKVKDILVEAAEEGKSYAETAKLIEEQGSAGVFSRARAQLIAINEVGQAYGTGNHEIVTKFIERTGSIVQKYWQTSNDDRVTPECEANEEAGWIGYNDAFPSGDEQAPRASNPRCRCVTSYQTVDANGDPV